MLLIVLETVLQISAAVRQISAALLPVLHNGELRVHGCLTVRCHHILLVPGYFRLLQGERSRLLAGYGVMRACWINHRSQFQLSSALWTS